MGLMLQYKKYQPKYFNWNTHEEFPAKDINIHFDWYREEYDNDGNITSRNYSDLFWEKWEYNKNGNEIYYENSQGQIRKSITIRLTKSPMVTAHCISPNQTQILWD